VLAGKIEIIRKSKDWRSKLKICKIRKMGLPNLFPLIKIQTSISIKAILTLVFNIQMEIMGLTFKTIKTIYKGIITFQISTEENNNKWIVTMHLSEMFNSDQFMKIKMINSIQEVSSNRTSAESRKLSILFSMAIPIKLRKSFLKSWVWRILTTIFNRKLTRYVQILLVKEMDKYKWIKMTRITSFNFPL